MNTRADAVPSLSWQVKLILIAGAFGGMFPCVTRVAVAFTQGGDLPVSLSYNYWIGAVLLAVLGSGVAWIFDEGNAKKAFFLGLSLPSFLQLQLSENIKSLATKNTADSSWLISSAVAQEPTAGVAAAAHSDFLVRGRVLRLETQAKTPVKVQFTDAQGKNLASYSIEAPAGTPLAVPDDATHVTFGNLDAKSASIALPAQAQAEASFGVTVKQDSHYGFIQALGAKPDVSSTLEVRRMAVAPPPPGG